jgi:hypothetical protein
MKCVLPLLLEESFFKALNLTLCRQCPVIPYLKALSPVIVFQGQHRLIWYSGIASRLFSHLSSHLFQLPEQTLSFLVSALLEGSICLVCSQLFLVQPSRQLIVGFFKLLKLRPQRLLRAQRRLLLHQRSELNPKLWPLHLSAKCCLLLQMRTKP